MGVWQTDIESHKIGKVMPESTQGCLARIGLQYMVSSRLELLPKRPPE